MTASSVKERLIPAGKLYWDDGYGERYIGLTPGFTITIASEKAQCYSAESGVRQLDDETVTSVTRTGNITCKQISLENLELFLIGDSGIETQAGAAVTNEDVTVIADRYYQLGTAIATPSGVRDISAVTITDVIGEAAVAWAADTVTTLGTYIKPLAIPNNLYYKATARDTDFKTHATTEPIWPTTIGATIVDDAVTWTCWGYLAPVLSTDYTVNADLARIYVLPGVRLPSGLTTAQWHVDYTKATTTWDQLNTTALAAVSGKLRFEANAMKGTNRDIYAPNCTMTPAGDAIFKADSPDYITLGWDVSFSTGLNDEPALTIDGRPA